MCGVDSTFQQDLYRSNASTLICLLHHVVCGSEDKIRELVGQYFLLAVYSLLRVAARKLVQQYTLPLCPRPQHLSPPCLPSPRRPVHSVLLYNLCHLHVSSHHAALSTVSSTTSVTSKSLLTTPPCPQCPLQPLSPPCLSSPQSPVHSVLLYNLCHLHVSPHHKVLSVVSSSTTSVTSMSLLTTPPCSFCPPAPASNP